MGSNLRDSPTGGNLGVIKMINTITVLKAMLAVAPKSSRQAWMNAVHVSATAQPPALVFTAMSGPELLRLTLGESYVSGGSEAPFGALHTRLLQVDGGASMLSTSLARAVQVRNDPGATLYYAGPFGFSLEGTPVEPGAEGAGSWRRVPDFIAAREARTDSAVPQTFDLSQLGRVVGAAKRVVPDLTLTLHGRGDGMTLAGEHRGVSVAACVTPVTRGA